MHTLTKRLTIILTTVALTSSITGQVHADSPRGPTIATSPVSGAVLKGTPSITLYVSNTATNGYAAGNDQADGTSKGAPLRTIDEAAQRALVSQGGGTSFAGAKGTTVIVNDGTYHEYIDWRGGKSTIGAPVPVIIKAEHDGHVTVTGSDTQRTTNGVTVSYATTADGADAWNAGTVNGLTDYSHRWVNELGQNINTGFLPNPFGSSATYGAVARRREMAFLNGSQLKQVLCKKDLVRGTFYISDDSMSSGYKYPYALKNSSGSTIDTLPARPCTETTPDHKIYVVPFGSAPTDWGTATFETTFRGMQVHTDSSGLPVELDGSRFLFDAYGKGNFELRGLAFTHATSRIGGSSAAVRLENSRNVLLDKTYANFNNWIGIATYGIRNPNPGTTFSPTASGVTIRDSSGNSNGGHGVTATRMNNLIIEDSEFKHNNIRGDWASLWNWDPGNKLMWVHNVIVRRSTFSDNHSHGLWLDTNAVNVTVEDSTFSGNRGHGLYIEASIGPVVVQHNTFENNGTFQSYPGIEGYGIFATFDNNVTIDSNTFIGNDIPLVIAGRTQHTHEPVGNSYDFRTGLSFANTANDPRGANWRITNNTFRVTRPTVLITLGVPPANFSDYIRWAYDNNWTDFLDTLVASNNTYSSPIAGGTAFSIQNTRSCLTRYSNGSCDTYSAVQPFTNYTLSGWQSKTQQDTTGTTWAG